MPAETAITRFLPLGLYFFRKTLILFLLFFFILFFKVFSEIRVLKVFFFPFLASIDSNVKMDFLFFERLEAQMTLLLGNGFCKSVVKG